MGGGPTGAWACEAAIDAGAAKVYWAGRPGKPIDDVSLREQLSALGLDAAQIDTFARAYNKRNGGVFKLIESGRIELRAQALEDAVLDEKSGRVNVTFPGDRTPTPSDGIVTATGQILDLPKGMDKERMVFRMVRIDHNGGKRLVALDAFDRDGKRLGIRIVGAQMAKAGPLVAQDEQEDFNRMMAAQANDPSVPADARGVPGSIYQTNIDVPLANEAAPLKAGEVK